MKEIARQWIISALIDKKLPALEAENWPAIVNLARSEGVLLLLESQLTKHFEFSSLSISLIEAVQCAARQDLLMQLQMLAEQQVVYKALVSERISFLAMKGGALAHWLYEKPYLRIITDLDLLFPDKDSVAKLEPILAAIGYVSAPVAGKMITHEHPFMKLGGPYGVYTVDAHWRLFNGAILADSFSYSELQSKAIELPGQESVRGLSPVHAFFNACGHRALNLPFTTTLGIQNANSLRWLWDIHAMAGQFSEVQWQEIVLIAQRKNISALVLDALLKTQSVFATQFSAKICDALQQHQVTETIKLHWFTAWPRYQWRVFIASSSSWIGRILWLIERIWPNPDAMRARYGENEPTWKFMFKRIGVGFKRFFR